jgi:hypothetical protein
MSLCQCICVPVYISSVYLLPLMCTKLSRGNVPSSLVLSTALAALEQAEILELLDLSDVDVVWGPFSHGHLVQDPRVVSGADVPDNDRFVIMPRQWQTRAGKSRVATQKSAGMQDLACYAAAAQEIGLPVWVSHGRSSPVTHALYRIIWGAERRVAACDREDCEHLAIPNLASWNRCIFTSASFVWPNRCVFTWQSGALFLPPKGSRFIEDVGPTAREPCRLGFSKTTAVRFSPIRRRLSLFLSLRECVWGSRPQRGDAESVRGRSPRPPVMDSS